jgi:putative ABC transport system permease protein
MTLAGLAARNVLRNKVRALLTVLGVAVAIVTFVLLRTLVSSWADAANFAAKDRMVTRHKITFVMTLPKRYVEQVRNAPHVKLTTFANWFGAKDPKHDKEFFGNFAVESDTYFKVYDDMYVAPDVLDTWQHDAQGAIVGDVLAKKMGWKVGDRVSLVSGIYAVKPEWEFKIDGIYEAKARSVDRSSFFFHYKYMNEAMPETRKNQVGWIVSRVDDPNRTADIAVSIDKIFDDQEIQTLSQDEHSFTAGFLAGISAVLTAINIVSGVILVIMMLVLGNTIAMGVRERTNEYGVLKALGFSSRHIATFVLVESMVIAIAGGALGLAIAYPFVQEGMGRWLEENMGNFFPYFRVPPSVAVSAIVLALTLGVIAAALPAFQASRLRVVDALRRVA